MNYAKEQLMTLVHQLTASKTSHAQAHAAFLASRLQLSRNVVSQYLNEMVKEGLVIKVNSRPVLFLDKQSLEVQLGHELNKSYDHYEDIWQAMDFQEIIGYKGSLKNQIEKCKAAMCYPPHGLPILLVGPTGSGKTMLASCMDRYAHNQGLVASQVQMMSLNCSEYANNPELLTDNLFGHVKGAYTGADQESEGLIGLANEGILFLDEVHCLPPECQEKLFQLMDKGIYHKVGDNSRWYHSSCRLVFATTQDPQEALLKTLLRRIPITVSLPALNQRPLAEKHALLYRLLLQEGQRLNKGIELSTAAYHSLLENDYRGNIGELKNTIQAICARLLVHEKNEHLVIRLLDLPENVLVDKPLRIPSQQTEQVLPLSDYAPKQRINNPIVDMYDQLLHYYEEAEHYDESFIQNCRNIIGASLNSSLFSSPLSKKMSNDAYLLKIIDKIYSIVMNKYALHISNSQIALHTYLFSKYTQGVYETNLWISEHEKQVATFVQTVQQILPQEMLVAQEIVANTRLNLDITIDEMMPIIIGFGLMNSMTHHQKQTIGLILCHGYSTASSIADTANYMLESHVFDGIDMEMHTSMDKMVALVNAYLKQKSPIHELMILVDMGSLEEIAEKMPPFINCNITLVSHVSTMMALEVGNWLKQGIPVRSIAQKLADVQRPTIRYIAGRQKQKAIITLCATGIATARKISEMIQDSLPVPIDLKVIAVDYASLASQAIEATVFQDYQVLLMIGTLDPKIEGIDYIGIESIMEEQGLKGLAQVMSEYLNDEQLAIFQENIIKQFTLPNMVNHLTILNPEKVLEDVQGIVSTLEEKMNYVLEGAQRIGLYIHISCLIERLLLKQAIDQVEIMEMSLQDEKRIQLVVNAFEPVAQRYGIRLTIPEVMYILNYFPLN